MYYSVSDKHSSNLLVLIRITLVLEPLHVEFYNLRLEALHVVREIDDLSIFIAKYIRNVVGYDAAFYSYC